jgi:hypothetical protein
LQTPPTLAVQQPDLTSRYYGLGLEAADWITSFQVTPLNVSWGIPYQDQRTWGLDPFYFENGTITAGTEGITAGQRQTLAFLIAGHDAGLGASAALDAYLQTKDPRYLNIFNVYYDYFRNAQIPSGRDSTPAIIISTIHAHNFTLDNSGYWAEQADVSAGPDARYGTQDDSAKLRAAFPSPEHGNLIAAALISYFRWAHDESALQTLNRYGNWLVKLQIKTGNYTGAFPVTQYYWDLGWKPRMYETTESAWILAELYQLTGNVTYLNSAAAAGQYMMSRQFTGPEWVNTPVYGALPYEWNGTKYTTTVSTNHAGFTLLAWTQLYRLTGDKRYLNSAETYAKWLMSFQVTNTDMSWGNHTYANDPMAVGGYYYGYDTEKHKFGSEVALSLWSAAYSIRGLLFLTETTRNETYARSAELAADWLTRMRYPDTSLVPLQALAITKYVSSSWWGIYPQFYQPDMAEVEKAGITSFVKEGQTKPQAILNLNRTWFERTYGVDFNLIDYQMASRGPQFMKMIWSWWPDLGFEPRYGGDIAFGAFTIGNYLTFNEKFQSLQTNLIEIQQVTSDQTLGLPKNVTTSYQQAKQLASEAERNFNESWYSAAMAEVNDASALAQKTIRELGILVPILQTNRITLEGMVTAVVALSIVDVYLYHALTKRTRRQRARQRSRRRRVLRHR